MLFLRPQPAIRSLKYVLAFESTEARVEAYHGYMAKTLTELYGYGDEHFRKFIRLKQGVLKEDLKQTVEDLSIELIHSQNAPDILTRAAVEAIDEIPIIHENQDTISLRRTPYTPESNFEKELADEKIANENCNARIHVSQGLLDYVQGKYGSKNDIVFPNYVSRELVPSCFKRKLSEIDGLIHIVYEGTLSSHPGDHYDLKSVFVDLTRHGYHVHIYDSHLNEDYRKLGQAHAAIHYHGHMSPKELPYKLTQYDYGWAGFNAERNKEHLDVALPNKLFEYLASGLPVLSFPHKAQKEFIETNRVGLVFRDLDQLDEEIGDRQAMDQLRRQVIARRYDFTMEANIGRVLTLYQELLR